MKQRTSLRLAGALIVVALALTAVASPTAARTSRVFASNCGKTAYRPHQLVVFCGDAGLVLDSIHWKHWGRRSANGDGTAFTKSCDPDCATGGVKRDAVSVRLSHRHYCGSSGSRYFLRITVHYPAGNILKHSLGCPY